jgi:hypothetical protein
MSRLDGDIQHSKCLSLSRPLSSPVEFCGKPWRKLHAIASTKHVILRGTGT